MKDKTPIGRRIRFAREEMNWSQERLGALLSPPKSNHSIADIEAGKTTPSWEIVTQIAEVLGRELEYFTDKACPECNRLYSAPIQIYEPEYKYIVTALEKDGGFSAKPYIEYENEDVARDLIGGAQASGSGEED